MKRSALWLLAACAVLPMAAAAQPPATGARPPAKNPPNSGTQPPKSQAPGTGATRQPGRAKKPPAVGEVAPEWTLKDAAGKEHKLTDYKGKIVVIDFWATWCPPCRKAMPAIQKLHETYKDKGVVVVGITDEGADKAAKYMKEKGFTYTNLVEGAAAAEAYGISGIPVFYIIGADGKILFYERGYNPANEEKMVKAIDAAIAARDAEKK